MTGIALRLRPTAAGPARRDRTLLIATTGFAVAFAATVLAAIAIGAVPITLTGLLAGEANIEQAVFWDIRLPRVIMGILVGAALAVAGASLQGLFRNPLADPGLIGVSSGAALFAAIAIVLGAGPLFGLFSLFGAFAIAMAAFTGGLLVTLLVYALATRNGTTMVSTMLLAGIAVNAVTNAGIGLLIFVGDDQQLRDLNFWLLGSLGGLTWQAMAPVAPLILLSSALLILFAPALNALLLGEADAYHLGFPVQRVKRMVVVLTALTVGGGVALTGIIGFVGLVVPHLVRLMVGPDHRALLPLSMVLGATLLVGADLVSRLIVLPAEMPIGIITSAIGAPFFLWLLATRHGKGVM
ncbi:MAG: iron ABC transporter permease [Alphaproteobacteria bacterium]|nr:iron ABC transporter permease [Alphaproteobacteria bacterium]